MSLSDEQFEFFKDLTKFKRFLINHESVTKVTLGEAQRSQQIQNLYFFGYKIILNNEGYLQLKKCRRKSKKRISNHAKKVAQDLNIWINGVLTYKKRDLQFAGDYWEFLNPKNRWGGNYISFNDTSHYEHLI